MRTFTAILFIIGGVVALASPLYSGVALIYVLGAACVVGGIVQAFAAFSRETTGGVIGYLLLGVVYVIGGIFIMGHPLLGAVTLTLVIGIFLIVQALNDFAIAFDITEGRGLFIFNGIISGLMAVVIFSGWPVTGLWVPGVLLGVNLLITGIAILTMPDELDAAPA